MANEPSTLDLIQIQEVRDGVIILKDGSLRGVIHITAINFELRSTDEQQAILEQFAGFLNSVDFPIQMVVHSRRYDIHEYVSTVQAATEQLTNELLKVQAQEYMRFVTELAELANIMMKSFYVVVPLVVTTATESKGIVGSFKELFKKAPPSSSLAPEQLALFKAQLTERANLITGGLSGMGLKGELLGQEQLIRLFNEVYNPVVPEGSEPSAASAK